MRHTVQPVKMETIAACSSKPRRATKICRRLSGKIAPLPSGPPPPEGGSAKDVARRQLCEEMLEAGQVQSFVDFFYLTHRPDPKALSREGGDAASETVADIAVPAEEMLLIRDNLTRAEMARRKGETASVYESFANLAQYFQKQSEDPKTGIYFYEKCLEIARITGDFKGEMRANHDLGCAQALVGDLTAAATFHERHLTMAEGLENDDEVRAALRELIGVYRSAALEREKIGDTTAAALFYERCLEAARSAGDCETEARAGLALGETLLKRGEAPEAIRILEAAEILCRQLDDKKGQGQVCRALAKAHRLRGDDSNARDFLERFLDIAVDSDDLEAEADACATLGDLLTHLGQQDRAVKLLTRNFAIAKQLLTKGRGSAADLDDARITLGIAIGYAHLQPYVHALKHDLNALLAWKINRHPLPTPPIPPPEAHNKKNEKKSPASSSQEEKGKPQLLSSDEVRRSGGAGGPQQQGGAATTAASY